MLPVISNLFEGLNASEIRYCHWKSNWNLENTLIGDGDIDLLIHRQDAAGFRKLLQHLGFQPGMELGNDPFPSVENYYAHDASSGSLIHVHTYYRIVSGGSLSKSYRLPLEEMLLGNIRQEGLVKIPTLGAELIIFVLRMCLKHTDPFELALLTRDWKNVRKEVEWLVTNEAQTQAAPLRERWLPFLSPVLFSSALDALSKPAPLWTRVVLAHRMRAKLKPFARHNAVKTWSISARKFIKRGTSRLRGSRR